jgi:hypothetical protein
MSLTQTAQELGVAVNALRACVYRRKNGICKSWPLRSSVQTYRPRHHRPRSQHGGMTVMEDWRLFLLQMIEKPRGCPAFRNRTICQIPRHVFRKWEGCGARAIGKPAPYRFMRTHESKWSQLFPRVGQSPCGRHRPHNSHHM